MRVVQPPPGAPCCLQRVTADAVHSLRQVLGDIVAKEGVAGLFKGAMPSIIKAAPSAAVTFAAYEFILNWLMAQHQAAAGSQPGAASGDKASRPRRPLH